MSYIERHPPEETASESYAREHSSLQSLLRRITLNTKEFDDILGKASVDQLLAELKKRNQEAIKTCEQLSLLTKEHDRLLKWKSQVRNTMGR